MGLKLIGTAGSDEKCQLALGMARPMRSTTRRKISSARQADHRRAEPQGGLRLGGQGHLRALARLPAPLRAGRQLRQCLGQRCRHRHGPAGRQGFASYVTRPTLFTHIATREATQAMADDLFSDGEKRCGEDPHRPALCAEGRGTGAPRSRSPQDHGLQRLAALSGFRRWPASSSALPAPWRPVRCSWTSRRSIQVSGCRRPSGRASTGPRMGSSSMRDSW